LNHCHTSRRNAWFIFGSCAAGTGIGLLAALVVSRSLHAVLFGIAASDWRVYATVAAAVFAAALLSSLWPALRAASVNPSVVMRQE
jgi:ABC-type antimicrobial peptide transport system permease subunit